MKGSCFAIYLLILFFGFNAVSLNSGYNSQEKEYWLFVGNPGAGKSTIINSLLKQEIAKAGTSAGGGLTKNFALYPHGNITYVDTPGLEDIENRAGAAKEIEKALKQDGKYRIFFIIKTDNLRIRPADLATIDIVLDAINLQNIEYNIIINQLTGKDAKVFYSNSDTIESSLFYSYFQSGKYKNNKIRFIDMNIDVLMGKSNLIDMNDFLKFAFMNSSSIYLPKNRVGTVNGQTWDEKLDEVKKNMKQAKIDLENEKNRAEAAEKKVEELKEEIRKEREINWEAIIATTMTIIYVAADVVATVL